MAAVWVKRSITLYVKCMQNDSRIYIDNGKGEISCFNSQEFPVRLTQKLKCLVETESLAKAKFHFSRLF